MDILQFIIDNWLKLLPAAGTAVGVTFAAIPLFLIVGLVCAVVQLFFPRYGAPIVKAYLAVFRGTPLLIQVFWIFYGLPLIGLKLHPLLAGLLALTLNFGAYAAEIFRSGLMSVAVGQYEAGKVLGLGRILSLRKVALPQAFVVSAPALANQIIELFKNTSLLGLITVAELIRSGRQLSVATYNPLGSWLLVAAYYIVIAGVGIALIRRFERRANRRLVRLGVNA